MDNWTRLDHMKSHGPLPRPWTTFGGDTERCVSERHQWPRSPAQGVHSSLSGWRKTMDTHARSPPYQIYYSNGTNTAGGAHGDTAQDFLPSSFCPKRTSTRLFLPPFRRRIHYGPFTQINLLMRLFLTFFGHVNFPLNKSFGNFFSSS